MVVTRWKYRACLSKKLWNPLRFSCCPLSTNSRFFKVSEEVQQAIAERRAVVALETTIYTHGFPYPDNLALASRLESLVRINGGVPATIGILDGVARVGLGADELVRLVSSAGSPDTLKISRRDLGFACGSRTASGLPFNGGTTIAGTMVLAHMAGIKIFATGGLGGVHRGAEKTMDISADLTELGRTPVTVISSGCKSFLDIPKTLEFLETQGVAVATFSDGRPGRVDFPAFWSRESSTPSPKVVQDEVEAAEVIHAHLSLGLQSGLHFANPIPEQHSLAFDVMEAATYEALEHANVAGAVGAAATPFILSKIKEISGDRTIPANKALVEANVTRGAKVARELQRLEMDAIRDMDTFHEPSGRIVGPAASNYTHEGVSKGVTAVRSEQTLPTASTSSSANPDIESREEVKPNVFVAGSLAIDLACDYSLQADRAAGEATLKPALHTSNPAQISQSLGGVGSNVARAAHLMGANVRLCSAVGDDLSGKTALQGLNAADLSTKGIKTLPKHSGGRTAQYIAVNDSAKDLVLAVADMSVLDESNTISQALSDFWLPQLREVKPSHLAVDANWSPDYLARWLDAGKEIDAHITFEPVSNAKSASLFRLPNPYSLSIFPKPSVHLSTPNEHELAAMHTAARETGAFDRADWWDVIDALGIPATGARSQLALATSSEMVDRGIPQQSIQLLPFIPSVCIKLGRQGVLLTQLLYANDERLTSKDHAPYILSRCANGTEGTLGVGGVYMRLFPPAEDVGSHEIKSVNGIGDTFVGTLVAGLAKRGQAARVEDLIDLAQRAAILTLKSTESVSPGLGTLRLLL